MQVESILRMLSEFNSFERVKRRELKYRVNGVSRRISLTNNSPFKQSYFSLSIIKALPYCIVQIMRVLLLKSLCGYEEQL